jgi:hypothetical protein
LHGRNLGGRLGLGPLLGLEDKPRDHAKGAHSYQGVGVHLAYQPDGGINDASQPAEEAPRGPRLLGSHGLHLRHHQGLLLALLLDHVPRAQAEHADDYKLVGVHDLSDAWRMVSCSALDRITGSVNPALMALAALVRKSKPEVTRAETSGVKVNF